jgi:WASH complex subunit 7
MMDLHVCTPSLWVGCEERSGKGEWKEEQNIPPHSDPPKKKKKKDFSLYVLFPFLCHSSYAVEILGLVGEKHLQSMKEWSVAVGEEGGSLWRSVWEGHLPVPGAGAAGVGTASATPIISLWRALPSEQVASVNGAAYEQTTLHEAVKTDNQLYNKLTLVFVSLMHEADVLMEECRAKYLPQLALFGSGIHNAPSSSSSSNASSTGAPASAGPMDSEEVLVSAEGDAQIWMGRLWPVLLSLSHFVGRISAVVINMMRQIASLYHPQQRLYEQSYQHVHLTQLYAKLGALLSTAIELDVVIAANDALPVCWGMYKRMLKTIKKDPGQYGVDDDTLWQFDKLMYRLKGLLMEGQIYSNIVQQEFDFPSFFDVRNNPIFQKEFLSCLRRIANNAVLDTGRDSGDVGLAPISDALLLGTGPAAAAIMGPHYVSSCALFGLWFNVWRQQTDPAKKLFKLLWEAQKRFPLVPIFGSAYFDASVFLTKVADPIRKATKAPNLLSARTQVLSQLLKELPQRVQLLYLAAVRWITRVESDVKQDLLGLAIGDERVPQVAASAQHVHQLLLGGIKVSHWALHLVKSCLLLHTATQQGLKATLVPLLFECLHIVVAIRMSYQRHQAWLTRAKSLQLRQLQLLAAQMLIPVRQRMLASAQARKLKEGQLDQLAALTLGIHTLGSAMTPVRFHTLCLALSQSSIDSMVKDNEVAALEAVLSRALVLSSLDKVMFDACDCSFLFWYQDLLPIYFRHLFKYSATQATKLPYVFAALGDAAHLARDASASALSSYVQHIAALADEHLVLPLCREVEKDLRLHVHSQYAGMDGAGATVNHMDPFRTGVVDFSALLTLPALRLDSHVLDIADSVTHYLDSTFYNLNTVALYDWQTYGEMRNVARDKYGLELQEVHLPGQTLEQGLDVLEIMRNIHIFVRKYNYNMNNQIFIEKSSESKTLNTINIQHIANSIRTHGTGIMNTTVNFTYQYLKQKMRIFSEFLFDEHIKSSLFREIRFFLENKEQLDSKYPYERADKLTRDIRKLGVLADNQTYLDKFRVLISEIGNAMGYVRMIRSGGLLYTSNAIRFVPSLEDIAKFGDWLQDRGGVAPDTVSAARNLDSVIESLSHHFAEGTDYFRMFVQVFHNEFRSAQNSHLKNFYMIVPALTVSFVEHMLVQKEKIGKKGKSEGIFTDDGFVIGIAYLLKLLDQNKEFDSLHWFESVLKKFQAESKDANANKDKDKDLKVSTAQLTINKIQSLHSEFSLVNLNLTGASIFFLE